MKSTKWSSHALVFLKDHTGEMCCSRKYAYFCSGKCLDLTSLPFNTHVNSTLALCLPCTWLLRPNTPCPWHLETSHMEGIVNFWHSGHCQFTVTVIMYEVQKHFRSVKKCHFTILRYIHFTPIWLHHKCYLPTIPRWQQNSFHLGLINESYLQTSQSKSK